MIETEGQAPEEHEEEVYEEGDTEELPQSGTEESEGEYKIGDQSFKTSEEAFAYANNLVQQKDLSEAHANAYRQAVADVRSANFAGQNVTQTEEEEDDPEFDQKFYEDPKKFLKEFGAKIEAQAEQRILGRVEQQSADEKLWATFFSQNPDLRDFREDCEVTLARHTQDLKAIGDTKGQKAAMDFLAQKTRAKFQAYYENSKPKRELHRTNSGPSHGSPENVTRTPAPKQDLDFAAELRNLRGKRA